MIKAVFVDVDDTLIDFYASAHMVMDGVFRDCDLPYSERAFESYHRVSEMLWDRVNRRLMSPEGIGKLRWELVFRELGIEGCPWEQPEELLFSRLREVAVPIPGAKQLLQSLSRRWPVYAASNSGGNIQHRRLQVAGLSGYLSGSFVSSEIGFVKPDPRFFERCLEGAGVSAAEAVMIGDNPITDMATPKAMGFKTCLLDPKGDKDRSQADFSAASLAEIEEMLAAAPAAE